MFGYQVDIDTLRRAAEAATSAGQQAAGIALGEAVTPVDGAMPGSQSAGRAHALAAAWSGRMRDWAADMEAHGDDLAAAAAAYTADDAAARQDFDVLGGLLGGYGFGR